MLSVPLTSEQSEGKADSNDIIIDSGFVESHSGECGNKLAVIWIYF